MAGVATYAVDEIVTFTGNICPGDIFSLGCVAGDDARGVHSRTVPTILGFAGVHRLCSLVTRRVEDGFLWEFGMD